MKIYFNKSIFSFFKKMEVCTIRVRLPRFRASLWFHYRCDQPVSIARLDELIYITRREMKDRIFDHMMEIETCKEKFICVCNDMMNMPIMLYKIGKNVVLGDVPNFEKIVGDVLWSHLYVMINLHSSLKLKRSMHINSTNVTISDDVRTKIMRTYVNPNSPITFLFNSKSKK